MLKSLSKTYISRKLFGKQTEVLDKFLSSQKKSPSEKAHPSPQKRVYFLDRRKKKFEHIRLDKRCKYYNELEALEVMYGKMFHHRRSFQGSYSEIAAAFGIKTVSAVEKFMKMLELRGYITIQATSYKGTKICGKNKYTVTHKGKALGEKLLKAILDKAYNGTPIPQELDLFYSIKDGSFKKLTKAQVVKKIIENEKRKANISRDKARVTKVTKNICQEQPADCGFSSSFDEMKERLTQQELKKWKIIPKVLAETANRWNLLRVLDYTAQEIIKALKSLRQKKNIRHPWKYFTYLLNKIKNERHLFTWHNQLSKNYLDAANDIKNKHTEKLLSGVDSRKIIDSLREIQKKETISLKTLGNIIRRSKGNTSKIANDLDVVISQAEIQKTDDPSSGKTIQAGKLRGVKDASTNNYYFRDISSYKSVEKITAYRTPDGRYFENSYKSVEKIIAYRTPDGRYFENSYKSVEKIIAYRTPDGRYFENLKDAIGHCESKGIKIKAKEEKKSSSNKPKLKSIIGFWYWISGQDFKSKSEFYQKKNPQNRRSS